MGWNFKSRSGGGSCGVESLRERYIVVIWGEGWMACVLMALGWDVGDRDGSGREASEVASLHACISGGYRQGEREKSWESERAGKAAHEGDSVGLGDA